MWLKGEKGGETVWIRYGSGANATVKTFIITNKWQQYSIPVEIPARLTHRSSGSHWNIRASGKNDVIFLDGIQLEKGYDASEFED